jgi:hypothetical protein
MPSVLKTDERESVPWVRIPPFPPRFERQFASHFVIGHVVQQDRTQVS